MGELINSQGCFYLGILFLVAIYLYLSGHTRKLLKGLLQVKLKKLNKPATSF